MEDKAINISEFKLGRSPVPYQARAQVTTSLEPIASVDANRTVQDWHVELPRFISYVEDKLLSMASAGVGVREFASRAMLVMREIFRRETGLASLEAIDDFSHNLWGASCEKELIRNLLKNLSFAFKNGGTGLSELLEQMLSFLNWYALRKRSLMLIDEQERFYRFDAEEKDRIFGFQVYPDVVDYAGLRGFKVAVGLRFCNRVSESLWFKVSLRNGEEFVKAAPGWGEWSEECAQLIGANGGAHKFVALQPIQPRSQRVLIDKLQLFVPYSALQLDSTELNTVLEASVCSQNGEKLLAWTEEQALVLPRSAEGLFLPSPQTLGLWRKDPASGDEVTDVSLSAGIRDEKGHAFGVLRVKSSLRLHDHQGEVLRLRYRFLDLNGDLVAAREKQSELDDGNFGITQQVLIRHAIEELKDVEVLIPLDAVELQKLMYLELSVLDSGDREACGMIVPVRYEHSLSEFTVQRTLKLEQGASELRLKVDEAHGQVSCRAYFTDVDWSKSPGRVVFALKPLGADLLQDDAQYRVYCVGGTQTRDCRELEASFSTKRYFEIDEDNKQDMMQFEVSCYLVSLEDVVLNSLSKTVSVTRAENYAELKHKLPSFVSVKRMHGKRPLCRVVANVAAGSSEVFVVKAQVSTDSSKKPRHTYHEVSAEMVANSGVFRSGLAQVALDFPLSEILPFSAEIDEDCEVYFSLLSVDGVELDGFLLRSAESLASGNGAGSKLKSRFKSWATSAFASNS